MEAEVIEVVLVLLVKDMDADEEHEELPESRVVGE